MIRALLLGAFATTAYGAWTPGDDCEANLAAAACKNFAETSDFNIANNADTSTQIDLTYKTTINAAYSYIGQGPWNEYGAKQGAYLTGATGVFPGQNSGLVFNNQGSVMSAITCVATTPHDDTGSPIANTFPFGCPPASGTGAITGDACQDNTIVMTGSIEHMVRELDTSGDYKLFFQRVDVNPINGNNIELNWIAENACKLRVEVTFQCSGSECVEVTTIVCATFAGITNIATVASRGQVSTECKVPTDFQVSTDGGSTLGSVNVYHTDETFTIPSTPSGGAWTDAANGCIPADGRCFFQHNSDDAIVEGTSLYGGFVYKAYVKGPTGTAANTQINGRWSQQEETLHQAKYNLTVASAAAQPFNMAVNVKFHSTDNAVTDAIKNNPTDIKTVTGWNAADAAGPFLARSKVEMGEIVNHDHAYLQVVAQVGAAGSWFKDLKLTQVKHTRPGASPGDADVVTTDSDITMVDPASATAPTDGQCKIASSPAASAVASTEAGGAGGLVHWHLDTSAYWPMAFLYCESFMSTGFTDDNSNTAGPAVTAGDTLVISLSWKLAKQSTSSGKAQLLQEADAPGQNVEVSLTIQLGGGETTITTAGAGADGSADNTVTYIIIAVCVIAAALILAVVVVAFMCLRNRSQEQLVAMSPQKATVAAVYDISQPKAKADAMDV